MEQILYYPNQGGFQAKPEHCVTEIHTSAIICKFQDLNCPVHIQIARKEESGKIDKLIKTTRDEQERFQETCCQNIRHQGSKHSLPCFHCAHQHLHPGITDMFPGDKVLVDNHYTHIFLTTPVQGAIVFSVSYSLSPSMTISLDKPSPLSTVLNLDYDKPERCHKRQIQVQFYGSEGFFQEAYSKQKDGY